ncbi:MAG: hypothetical protein NDJ89_01785 [Oligoflexia bacterium]|nr:hypothetical protein [Oligoflexia bacterium]
MKRLAALAGTLLALPAFGQVITYPTLPADYVVDPASVLEIQNTPPVKAQGGLNLCYSHSTGLLLEIHDCRARGVPCKGEGIDERLSPLDLASYEDNNSQRITELGFSLPVLQNVQAKNPRIARESCIPYETLRLTEIKRIGNQTTSVSSEQVGHRKLRDFYLANRDKRDCASCVEKLRQELGGQLLSDTQQVLDALAAPEFDQFTYRALIPEKCKREGRQIAPFEIEFYPAPKQPATSTAFRDVLLHNLENDLPSEINLCTVPVEYGKCEFFHSLVITGSRKACSGGTCRLAFRVQNSFGLTWQEDHDDGWIDADWILERMLDASKDGNRRLPVIHWIHPPGKGVTPPKAAPMPLRPAPPAPARAPIPAPIPATELKPVPAPKKAAPGSCPPPANAPKGLYKCQAPDGWTEYSELPSRCDCTKLR